MIEMDEVILVDERDVPLGRMEKMEAHRRALLHRAFSVFVFSSRGEMLLQRRAMDKYHSAGLWTNACCSHPRPGEDTAKAAGRRLYEELGFTMPLEKAFEFTYRSEFDNGLTEYEFDHVYTGVYDGDVYSNPAEVSEHIWLRPEEIRRRLEEAPQQWTSWFRLAFPMVCENKKI